MGIWRGLLPSILRNDTDRYKSEELYQLLDGIGTDSSSNVSRVSHGPRRIRWRVVRILYHLLIRGSLVFIAMVPIFVALKALWIDMTPRFDDIYAFQHGFPQHFITQALEEGRLYLRFPGHLLGHDFSAVLQEALLMQYVAEKSGRAIVFEDYIWSQSSFQYTLHESALRASRIPMNAFLSGPSAGGPGLDLRIAAVDEKFWNVVCNSPRVIGSKDVPYSANGKILVDWWVDRIQDLKDDECVEIDSDQAVFDSNFFESNRVVSLWPELSSSPILQNFSWSPLVHSVVLRNFPAFHPESIQAFYDLSASTTLAHMIAIHLPRGDYKRHCDDVTKRKTQYHGFNQLPTLLDKFNTTFEDEDQRDASSYMEHCLPTIEQVLSRLHEIRRENHGLRTVYAITNAEQNWRNELRKALLKDGWEDLKSSLDLSLDPKQRQVGEAVDMSIAEKSQVFLGNGFSVLSSNVIMLRAAKGMAMSTNRLF